MNLNRDATGFTKNFIDSFLVILWGVGRFTVEVTHLQSINPRCDARVFSHNSNFRGVPVVDFPCLDPLCGSACVEQSNIPGRLVTICGDPNKVLVVVILAVDREGAGMEAGGPLTVKVPDVAGVMVIDHHLETLSLVRATHKQAGTNTPVRFHVNYQFQVAKFFVGQKDSTVTGTGRVLLTRDRAVFNLPLPTRPMTYLARVLVPPIEGFPSNRTCQPFAAVAE